VTLRASFIEITGQPLTSRTVKIRAAQGMEESQIGRGGGRLVRIRNPSINIDQRS